MPELPEVEAVKNGLSRLVCGKTIKDVQVKWRNIIVGDAEKFQLELIGQTIESFSRRGKFIIFQLSDYELISHLRMEGKYMFFQTEVPDNAHNHIFLEFSDGSTLVYNDVRKFGRMQLVPKGMALMQANIAPLGPEPFSSSFDVDFLFDKLSHTKGLIKPALLSQKIVVGLGNIYVDESLWQAKIMPTRLANTLSYHECQELYHAIVDVLSLAVKLGGSTIRTYKNALGEAGKFQQELHVYGLSGQPCARCATLIEKIKVAGRGTHFCPHCQK